MVFFMLTYLVATEYISGQKSKGEVLVFRRGHTPAALSSKASDDVEANEKTGTAGRKSQNATGDVSAVIERQTAIFHWQDVCYDIKIKSETRRILDHVDGWVQPGTLTALMVSVLLVVFLWANRADSVCRVYPEPARPPCLTCLLPGKD